MWYEQLQIELLYFLHESRFASSSSRVCNSANQINAAPGGGASFSSSSLLAAPVLTMSLSVDGNGDTLPLRFTPYGQQSLDSE